MGSLHIYTDAENLLFISSTYIETNESGSYTISRPLASVIVQASQGNISYAKPSIYYLSNLKAGTVDIAVFRPVDTGLLLLQRKSFQVQERQLSLEEIKILKLKVKPEFNINDYLPGDVPIKVIRRVTKLNVNAPFKLKRAVLFITDRYSDHPFIAELLSDKFDERLKKMLDKIGAGSTVVIDEIAVLDEKGITYYPKSIAFKIISDNFPSSN